MNIAIGSLNYDIILQVERMLFEHEKLSLFYIVSLLAVGWMPFVRHSLGR